MEPQRGEEQLVWAGVVGGNSGAGPARGPLSPRHALEQEMLHRAELQLQVGGGGGRHMERMMKNRESAARSRARRHAYVSELEKEVSLLEAENQELRKLCEELEAGAREVVQAVHVVSRAPAPRRLLRRTSSAPF